jgi:hypothetical protein
MSLSNKAVDQLFARLSVAYGASWTRQWADVPIGDLKTSWAYELSSFSNRLDNIAWALDNLPERCPNVIQFRNLCNQMPAAVAPMLPMPKADPARMAAELAKLTEVKKAAASSTVDHKAWAKRIQARVDAGDPVTPISKRFAAEALRKEAA